MMRIVHLAKEPKPKEKRLTKKQELHMKAMALLGHRLLQDEARANKRFAPELAQLEKDKQLLAKLKQEKNQR